MTLLNTEEAPKTKRAEFDIYVNHRNGVLVTAKQIQEMFDVTATTIHNYRRKYQLPYHHLHAPGLKKPPCRFDVGEVTHWAQLNNISIVNPIK